MVAKEKTQDFTKTCLGLSLFMAAVLAAALVVAFRLPGDKAVPLVSVLGEQNSAVVGDMPVNEDTPFAMKVNYDDSLLNINTKSEDVGLAMYRDAESKPAVEWFYSRITGNRAVSQAILAESDRNDIPPSLAFALAYAESRYDARAVNVNTNKSIDRGLFQLNNRTFTKLSEADFFNPVTNARHGLAHLRFCVGVAGNMVAALAMYNAGTTKVCADNTPKMTLNYIGKIMSYKQNIEKCFADEVLRYYDNSNIDDADGNESPASERLDTVVAINK